MTTRPCVSVIIPVYKVAAWLDACVESVLSQTYENLEIILVNDGSPDECGQICDRWAEKDRRIRVLHKENGGLSSARNAGLEIATGEYIMFLDSDDLLHPEICQHLYQCLTDCNAQISICDAAHIFPGQLPDYSLSADCFPMTSFQATQIMWYQHSVLPSAWAKLYRRDIFSDLRFTQGLLYEDIDLMHLAFYKADTIVYTPSRLYGYNHREDSITTKAFSKRDLDILTVAEKIMTFPTDTEPALLAAAKCYNVVAALRVVLNAPNTPEFRQGHDQARTILKTYGKEVLKNKNIRKKTRYGLMLYRYCRPLMSVIYKRINRWK